MTRKSLLVLTVAGCAVLAPGLLQTPAAAEVHWSLGTAFSVGGLAFNVVFGLPFGVYGDGFFYRTHRALHYPGVGCHGACSYRAGYYYHHRDCPLVGYHFSRHHFRPRSDFWLGFGRYDRSWRYRDGYRYYRHDYDRYRYDRYRYDRHRHDPHSSDRYRDSRRHFRDNDWDSDSDSDRWDRRRWDRSRDRWDDRRDRGNDRRRSASDTRRRRP